MWNVLLSPIVELYPIHERSCSTRGNNANTTTIEVPRSDSIVDEIIEEITDFELEDWYGNEYKDDGRVFKKEIEPDETNAAEIAQKIKDKLNDLYQTVEVSIEMEDDHQNDEDEAMET